MLHNGGDLRWCEIWTVDKEKKQIRMRLRAVPEERRWRLSLRQPQIGHRLVTN
jgi:hypothetical protein